MMVHMPRFQSRLFNWIDQSLPAQLGRRAREFIDQKITQLSGITIKELPRLLAYQVARAALYPVYLIASTTRRVFPALRPSSRQKLEQARSLENVVGILPEVANPDIQPDIQDLSDIPLLLRPLAKILNWFDLTKTQLDRNIAAIVKRQDDGLVANTNENSNPELNPKFLANRVFAAIWQEQVVQRQATENALKESNSLAEATALGKNTNLEKLKRLIEAAIAYFFGDHFGDHGQVSEGTASILESGNVTTNLSSLDGKVASSPLPTRDSSNRQRIKSPPRQERLPSDRRLAHSSAPPNVLSDVNSSSLKENAPLAEISRWERLRELIAAAIDYFIGKRSLSGDQQTSDQISDQTPEQISGKTLERSLDQLQTNVKGLASYLKNSKATTQASSANNAPTSNQNSVNQSDDALKFDDQLERLQRLRQIIEAALEYFFHKKRSPSLDPTTDIEPTESAWLTMEDVFGDDNGPWPMPIEYESVAFTQSSKYGAIHSSGDLQNFETTTTKISQDRLDGSLIFDDYEQDVLSNLPQDLGDRQSDRPLRAWIEARANLVGRRYSPVMVFVFWLDTAMLKMENLAIALWQSLVNFPRRLINLIRHGKFS